MQSVHQINFLRNTNKILLTSGPYAKVVSPTQDSSNLALFANFPRSQTDQINLRISRHDMEFLLDKLPWGTLSSAVMTAFLAAARQTYDSQSVSISYF